METDKTFIQEDFKKEELSIKAIDIANCCVDLAQSLNGSNELI
jgi:hypothetical protein